ncbi:MAG: hypothetical protein DCC55_13430 [Chloroflexi bacterium]|nr:MAG: hypothetical protein DCC55_13430 [Chloroflexota bacterium]
MVAYTAFEVVYLRFQGVTKAGRMRKNRRLTEKRGFLLLKLRPAYFYQPAVLGCTFETPSPRFAHRLTLYKIFGKMGLRSCLKKGIAALVRCTQRVRCTEETGFVKGATHWLSVHFSNRA